MKDQKLCVGPFALGKFAPNKVAIAAAVSLVALAPVSSWALGLGKLNVQSALGEPLRAEIDVTSLTPEESGSLQVRVASPETYRAAGVDYNQVLGASNISLQHRADGRPYLRISSDRTVQEPFVDVILDLSWSTGRLVREYTLLFDPPSNKSLAQTTPAVIDTPVSASRSTEASPSVAEPASTRSSVAAAEAPKTRASGKVARPSAAAASKPVESAPVAKVPEAAEAVASTDGAGSVKVKPGDTLSGIAGQHLQGGVSLDQMLVGLYRNNPNAFLGNNINRLKSGVVLNVPTAEQAKSVSNTEARQVIQAQSADFAAYRQRLAGTVTTTMQEQPQRQAKGKVEAEVEDRKQSAAPAPDKLTLSKGGVTSTNKPGAEDRLAKARAGKEEATRVAELSKNLDELRKLKEKAAAASTPAKPAAAAVPPPAPSKPVVVPPTPVVPSKPVAVPPPVVASAPTPAPVPSKPEPLPEPASAVAAASTPAEVASSATVVAEQASAPVEAPSSVVPAIPAPPVALPEPATEPSFLESLNPMLLLGGGSALALVLGAGYYLRSRRQKDTGETSFLESRLQPDSFFGASGGQRVDTRDATGGPSSMSYSLSQLDAIGDVDPVAEADVYLAYGRDLQAEEILKEALRTTPERLAVRTKLLEVYAKRRDTKGYEQLAVQLYNLTNGDGEDWAKAQEMGLGIDPENPLYQPGGQPSASARSGDGAAPDYLGATTVPHSTMPTPTTLGSTLPMATAAEAAAAEASEGVPSELVDLDLDLTAPSPLDEEVSDSVSPTSVSGDLPPLDLPDLEPEEGPLTRPAETAPMELPKLEPQAAAQDDGLDFDLSLDESLNKVAQASGDAKPSFDLNSISLDLDEGKPSEPAQDWTEATSVSPQELPTDPMARKFELAEEFRQIGDVDGARELLQEVIENSADEVLKAKAQGMLDNLS